MSRSTGSSDPATPRAETRTSGDGRAAGHLDVPDRVHADATDVEEDVTRTVDEEAHGEPPPVAVRAADGRGFDHDKIEQAIRLLLEAVGEDPERPGIVNTPARVARQYEEIFAGLLIDPAEVVSVTFDESYDEMVMMRDIPFHSVCEHHLVPFTGNAHIAYLPNPSGRVTGLSKLARLVDVCAKRPGLQERMTIMIADALERALEPRGVMVVVEARHLCMEMRGIRKPGAITVTSNVRGMFRHDPATRSEALALLRG